MARRHWIVMGAWVGVFTAAALACGDSVTGDGIPDNPDASSSGTDGSKNTVDSSQTFPDTGSSGNSSSGSPDTGTPDSSANIDGGVPTVSVTKLDFGEVDCGSTGQAQTFVIDNPSGSSISYSSQLLKGDSSPYTISPDSGTIAAGASLTVTVAPKQVPKNSTTSAAAFADTLKLAIGPTNTSIALTEAPHGAVLAFSPTTIAFGNTPIGISSPIPTDFAVTNAGSAPIPITLTITPDPNLDGAASAFSFSGTAPTTAGQGLTGAHVIFQPSDTVAYSSTVHLEVGSGPVCGDLPADLKLTGTGTNGVISVSPAQLTYGNGGRVDCGTTANVQKVRITNTASSSVTFTATLGKGTQFYGVSTGTAAATAASATGTINGNSFIDVNVQPKAIPSSGANLTTDFYADSLDITTSSQTTGATTDNTVPLHQTANGAILTRSTNGITFGSVAGGSSAQQQYTFSNTGNVDINVTLANALSSTFAQPATVSIPQNGFATVLATFKPAVSNSYPVPYTDTATIVQTGTPVALCGGFPSSLSFSGSAVAPTTTLSTTSVAWGQVPCGTPASGITPKVVHVPNNGPTVQFDLSLRKGSVNTPFTLGSPVLAIPAGGTADITITPKAIPTNLLSVADLTDTLDLVPEAGDAAVPDTRAQLSVNLAVTPQGAIITYGTHNSPLTFTPSGAIKNPNLGTSTITVNNIGNIPADLTFAVSQTSPAPAAGSNVFSVSPPTQTLQINQSGFTSTIVFSPPTPEAATTFNGVWGLTTTANLCSPLPAPPATPVGLTAGQVPVTASGAASP